MSVIKKRRVDDDRTSALLTDTYVDATVVSGYFTQHVETKNESGKSKQQIEECVIPVSETLKLFYDNVERFNDQLNTVKFSSPVTYVYNPTVYANVTFKKFMLKYGNGPKKILFIGMNPGPYGMSQTGVSLDNLC
jgi:hypothetical protein